MTSRELESIQAIARNVLKLLAARKFDELERAASNSRITALEIERAVDEFPLRLVPAPELELQRLIDVVPISGEDAFSVWVGCWDTEGRSDLQVRLTVQEPASESSRFELDDILVP